MAGRQKGYLYSIHRFYQYQALDLVMFGYCLGATRTLPTLSLNKAIEMFLADFNLCEDEYCFEAARSAYYRIMKSLKDKEEGEPDCYDSNSKK